MTADRQLVHGTCVSLGGVGLLVLGPPGSGKSDLALRLIDQPGQGLSGPLRQTLLVADDQVVLRRDGDGIIASPPDRLAGLLEIRGLGVMKVPHAPDAKLAAVLQLVPHSAIERLPDPAACRHVLMGVALPLFRIDPAAASAPARVRAAADWRDPV